MGLTGRTWYSFGENEMAGGINIVEINGSKMRSVGDDERRRVIKFPSCRQRGESGFVTGYSTPALGGSPAPVWALSPSYFQFR